MTTLFALLTNATIFVNPAALITPAIASASEDAPVVVTDIVFETFVALPATVSSIVNP